MASKKVGLKRLTKEYMRILKNPVECVEAHPLEEDLFEWYYVLKINKKGRLSVNEKKIG